MLKKGSIGGLAQAIRKNVGTGPARAPSHDSYLRCQRSAASKTVECPAPSSQAMVLQHLVAAFRVKGQAAPAQNDTAAVHGNRGRMLTVGKSHEQAPRAGSKTSAPWGGSTVNHKTAQPEIFLDDRDFGKY